MKKNIIKKIEKKYKETSLKTLVYLFLTFFIAGILLVMFYQQQPVQEFLFDREVRHDIVIKAPMGNLNVEVADNGFEREKGLTYRTSMNQDEGMLFVFDESGKYGFWAKDMNFPIDIVWLNEEGRVVYIVDNISPNTYPGAFINSANAKYVLEISAGVAEKYGIYLGTKLEFSREF